MERHEAVRKADNPDLDDPVKSIERQQRNYHIQRILRDEYGRIARETKRENINPTIMPIVDWFAALPPVRTQLPNVLIRNGDYIERMQISYAFFYLLAKTRHHGEIEVERARMIIEDFKWKRQVVKLQHVKYLILHDVDQFEDAPDALDELALERYRNGNATIFVGKFVAATDVIAPILQRCVTKIELGESLNIEHEHACMPEGNRLHG